MLAVPPLISMASSFSAAVPTLFPVALDHEERVIDSYRKTNHRNHVDDEEGEVHEPTDDSRQSDGHKDRDHRQRERQECGKKRTEHHDEHDQGGQQADDLTLDQVLLGDPVEFVGPADVTDGQHLDVIRTLRLDDRQVGIGVVLRLVQFADERDRDVDCVPVLGDDGGLRNGAGGDRLEGIGNLRDDIRRGRESGGRVRHHLLKSGSSAMTVSELTTTVSVTGRGPRSRSSSSVSAWTDSGLLVRFDSVVNASASPVAAAPARTKITNQMPKTRHGRRPLRRAMPEVEIEKPMSVASSLISWNNCLAFASLSVSI